MDAGGSAWHYTVGQAVVRIYRAGFLEAAPAVWFSTRPDIEPSCRRSVLRLGRPHLLTLGEMHRLYAGWFRFGLPAWDLLTAEDVRERAGLPRDLWRHRIKSARALGSDVGQWRASLERVDVDRCRLQRLDAHPSRGQWQDIPDPRAWLAEQLDAEIAAAWRMLGT